MEKFKNGAFVRGASSSMRKKSSPSSTYLPDTPVSMIKDNVESTKSSYQVMQIHNLLN
jgi:hypothetical protein